MGTDDKIHFTNSAGADTVLNFNKGYTSADVIVKTYTFSKSYASNGNNINASGTYNAALSGYKIIGYGAYNSPGYTIFTVSLSGTTLKASYTIPAGGTTNLYVRVYYLPN